MNHGKPVRQVMVPTPLSQQVIFLACDPVMGDHLCTRKTTDRVLSNCYWPGLRKDVARYFRTCDICQKTVKRGQIPNTPLQQMPLVDSPFKRVAVDRSHTPT